MRLPSVIIRTGLVATLLASCQASPPAARATREPSAGSGTREVPPPAFANTVWRVAAPSGIEAGALYVFLSDGSLLIASDHGTPSLGRWRSDGDTLTLVEEGIPHAAAILRRTADSLSIRFPGPGDPLLVTFVRAQP